MNYYYQNFKDQNIDSDLYANASNALMMQKVKGGSNAELFNENKAFMLGNLFKSLYLPYKQFTNFPIKTTSRRQTMLNHVQIHEFVAHEANLYLDNHPNDNEMLQLFHSQNNLAQKARKAFEKEFGPLSIADICDDKDHWDWINRPWPWEKQ